MYRASMATTPSIGTYGENLDLKVKQGSTFGPFELTFKNPDSTPVNLTGCDVRGQIRQKALDATKIADISFTLLDPVNGVVRMWLTDEQTAAIVAGESTAMATSKYVYDVELEDTAGNVLPMLYGNVNVFREVTR